MNYRNEHLLRVVRYLCCAMCGAEDGTVVAAHSNQQKHGKGTGIKADDWRIAALCHSCHAHIDQGKNLTKDERRELWNEAHEKTLDQMFKRGILEVSKYWR